MPEAADVRDASTYRDLLADPAWRRWTLVSAISRLPNAVAPLALVIVGRYATGSFADGALLAGAYAFSQALAAPWLGRLLDRRDRRRGLAIALGSTSLALAALLVCVMSRAPLALLLVATIAAGALPSAVQSGLRAFLVDLFAERAPLAFALDASLIELQWMSGPALVALLALLKLPYLTVAAMLAATLAALLATQLLPRGEPDLETAERRQSPWREPTAARLYVVSVIQG